MNYVARQNCLCAVHHKEGCISGSAIRRGPQPPEYGVELLDAHTSAADSLAAVGVADALARKYPQLQVPLAELHGLQVTWKAEQSASFQEYLRRKDPAAVVNGDWPVQGR